MAEYDWMRATLRPQYESDGVDVDLLRCSRCGAVVDMDGVTWPADGTELHTEWHAQLDKLLSTNT